MILELLNNRTANSRVVYYLLLKFSLRLFSYNLVL